MLAPASFLAKYGQALPRKIEAIGGVGTVLPVDNNRIVLAFWGSSGNVTISPQGQGSETFQAMTMAATSQPFILTHALHGQLVNMSWRLIGSAGVAIVTVIECFLREELPASDFESELWSMQEGSPWPPIGNSRQSPVLRRRKYSPRVRGVNAYG